MEKLYLTDRGKESLSELYYSRGSLPRGTARSARLYILKWIGEYPGRFGRSGLITPQDRLKGPLHLELTELILGDMLEEGLVEER